MTDPQNAQPNSGSEGSDELLEEATGGAVIFNETPDWGSAGPFRDTNLG